LFYVTNIGAIAMYIENASAIYTFVKNNINKEQFLLFLCSQENVQSKKDIKQVN
jgi:hypothetical protein